MNWKAHMFIGFIFFILIGHFFLNLSLFNLFFLSIISSFSALLPDLDHPISKSRELLNKLIPFVLLVVFYIYFGGNLYNTILSSLIFLGVYFVLFTFFKPRHRGITHSLFFIN